MAHLLVFVTPVRVDAEIPRRGTPLYSPGQHLGGWHVMGKCALKGQKVLFRESPYRADMWCIHWAFVIYPHMTVPECPVGAPLYIAQGNTLGGWHVIGEMRPEGAKGFV